MTRDKSKSWGERFDEKFGDRVIWRIRTEEAERDNRDGYMPMIYEWNVAEVKAFLEQEIQSARAEEYTKGYKDGLKKVTPKQGDMTDVCRSLFDEMKAKAKAEGAREFAERVKHRLHTVLGVRVMGISKKDTPKEVITDCLFYVDDLLKEYEEQE